jgi:glycosyltransferase involved in cell wall biosynthesis
MLWYLPLEGYKERYTMQWSAPETGWLERRWKQAGVEYTRIDPLKTAFGGQHPVQSIKVGSVVDGVARSRFCFSQVTELLERAELGQIKDSDVVYLDDFWTPGVEALPYAFHLLGVRPRVYAFLHAQSVDEFDFTHPMRSWMRHFEKGIGEFLDGILTSCPTLKDLIVHGGIAPKEKVHVTGHPFCSEEVMERMPMWFRKGAPQGDMRNRSGRDNVVVWSSRWDAEKDPEFFLKVVHECLRRKLDVVFKVLTSSPALKSNQSGLLAALTNARVAANGRLHVFEGLSKEAYYDHLCRSKVQFNCALQDFVPITLQEASVAGCYPIYPYFRAMPETFQGNTKFMYVHQDVTHAADMIEEVIKRDDLWSPEARENRAWIHRRFDVSWVRMLNAMGVETNLALDPIEGKYLSDDPFARRAR